MYTGMKTQLFPYVSAFHVHMQTAFCVTENGAFEKPHPGFARCSETPVFSIDV